MRKISIFTKIHLFFQAQKGYNKFKKLSNSQKEIVFYSESSQDWHHLSPYIQEIITNNDKNVTYITSTSNDPGLSYFHKNYISVFIPDGFWLISLFQFLDVPVMVMTMEDLDIFYLKKSINPVHYIFIFHAMGSTHMVNLPESYDNYNTLFCVGEHQEKEIRKREKQQNLPSKNIFKNGYHRLDQLILEKKQLDLEKKSNDSQKKILVAPTWGDNSILNQCGTVLIDILIEAGFKIILRPHYQTLKLTPEVIAVILKKYQNNPNFDYLCKMGDTSSLFESDLLICDWSSTSIEYALGLEKPVLYIDVPKRVRNEKYEELGIEPVEISIREKIGKVISVDNLNTAPDLIKELLANRDTFKSKISELRETMVYNIGNSAKSGGKEIVRILENIKK